MASGIFSTSTLGTGWSLVAAGAATANRIVTVSFTTRQTEVLPPFGKISLAIVPNGNLISADNEYIEFDSAILPGSIVEKTGIIISPDYDLIAKSSIATVDCVSYGVDVPPGNSTYVIQQTDITAAAVLAAGGPINIVSSASAGSLKVVTITITNRDTQPCNIDIGYYDGVNTTYIENNTILGDDGILERTGIILNSSYEIVIDATTSGTLALSVTAYGLQNTA